MMHQNKENFNAIRIDHCTRPIYVGSLVNVYIINYKPVYNLTCTISAYTYIFFHDNGMTLLVAGCELV